MEVGNPVVQDLEVRKDEGVVNLEDVQGQGQEHPRVLIREVGDDISVNPELNEDISIKRPEDSTCPDGKASMIPVVEMEEEPLIGSQRPPKSPEKQGVIEDNQEAESEVPKDMEGCEIGDEADVVAETIDYFWSYGTTTPLGESNPVLVPIGQTEEKEFQPGDDFKKKTSYLKGCKWSPDGSCLISNSDDDVLRLFNIPEPLHGVKDWLASEPNAAPCTMNSALRVKEGGQVYDYCWYPLMSSFDPVTCCFLTTSADSPVHLWDAFSGSLRASYLSYNQMDEVVAARSIAFDPTGQHIYCGFDTTLRIFDISRPGRQCTVRKLKHEHMAELSQPGIISCIAVNPAMPTVKAIGTYLKTVGLYYDDGSVLCILEGHMGGVTHLKFSHDGTKLFSGGRQDSRLICWDMRFMGEKYEIYDRVVRTNQRIYFDITPNDKYLVTGGTDGTVKIWDITLEKPEPLTFRASLDCVNGVSINPFYPLLATSSGQRHFQEVHMDSDSESQSDDGEEMKVPASRKFVEEHDIKLWKLY